MSKLNRDGIEFITYPQETKVAVAAAALAWEEFTQLPQVLKDRFTASQLQFSIGYERKGDGSRESKDVKENFDLTLDGIRALEATPHAHEIKEFLDTAKKLFTSLDPVADTFCQMVESRHDIPGFRQTATRSASNRFIRFLHYPPAPVGSVIGEAHTDHSGYTFHLYESTGGCHGLSLATNEWFDMPVDSGEMVVFGGMQLQLLSDGNIKALCHEITANVTTATAGRFAIVCFNLLDGVPTYDRATHGRLQDKPAGFNYSLEPTEFTSLFTPSKTLSSSK